MARRGQLALSCIALSLGLSASGCRDYEQEARAIGDEGRRQAEASCRKDAQDPLAEEACIEPKCHLACDVRELTKSFVAICLEACRKSGTCNVSEDCGPGLSCVAIAPRVRRCERTPDPAPSSSADR